MIRRNRWQPPSWQPCYWYRRAISSLGLGSVFGILGVRLGGNGLVDFHTLLVLRHIAAAHGHFAIAHRQVERHAGVVGSAAPALSEHACGGRIVLVVESVAALDLIHLGHPAVGLGHLVHVAVEFGQLRRFGEILQRLVVVLGPDRSAAHHKVAFGKRRLGRGHQRRSLLAVQPLLDHLFELRGLGEILCSESGCRLIVQVP